MDCLVTGAAGFIGAAIAERLINEGHTCVTVDNLSTGVKERIPDKCNFVLGDVFDPVVINLLKEKHFDAIFHIAGQSSGEVSFDDPMYDLQTNAQSTLLLLKLAKETGCKKFIYASSMAVYGGESHSDPCSEEMNTIPKSFYAVGKLASENYMRIYSGFGIACTSLRFFNVYGIGQNLNNFRQGMASIYLAMAIKKRHIHVKGSKERFRDFVYIDDVVDAAIKSLDREEGYDFFNVCTGISITVEKVVQIIRDDLPYDVTVEYSGGTPGDQFGIYGDNRKIGSVLGWKPKVNFDDGMKKMITWARNVMDDFS